MSVDLRRRSSAHERWTVLTSSGVISTVARYRTPRRRPRGGELRQGARSGVTRAGQARRAEPGHGRSYHRRRRRVPRPPPAPRGQRAGRHPQLTIEHSLEVFVLSQRGGPVASGKVALHELDVGLLVRRVQVGQRARHSPRCAARPAAQMERPRRSAAQSSYWSAGSSSPRYSPARRGRGRGRARETALRASARSATASTVTWAPGNSQTTSSRSTIASCYPPPGERSARPCAGGAPSGPATRQATAGPSSSRDGGGGRGRGRGSSPAPRRCVGDHALLGV